MAYKGRYTLTNPSKYIGNPNTIWYRSLWERQIMKYLESNNDVVQWSSECPIKYVSDIDGKLHTYYIDFYIKYSNGTIVLQECKPKKQCLPPVTPKKKTKRYVEECKTWIINNNKWNAAKKICEQNGYIFEIWTEDVIKSKGIKILT